jgi:hypothetical protein
MEIIIMEQQQALQNHLIAIEMYICHLGKTFEEACDELNLDITDQLALKSMIVA